MFDPGPVSFVLIEWFKPSERVLFLLSLSLFRFRAASQVGVRYIWLSDPGVY